MASCFMRKAGTKKEWITSRDVIMVQGIVVFIAVVYVCINNLVDLSYQVIDPRVRKVAAA